MIYSKIEGEGNLNKLLIIHGFLGMSDNWKTMATQYVAEGFEVHLLDMRNHGRSFHSDVFSYEVMATDVKIYCEANNIKKTSILGHSMGGKTAMLFACNYPEQLDKLLIADIGPKHYPQHHQNILAGLSAVDFSKNPSRNEIEAILSTFIAEVGTRQFLMKNLYWETPTQLNFRFNLNALIANIEEIGKALPTEKKYTGDTLFLKGALSHYILEEDIDGILQQFPKASVTTISKAGHWLHAENPAEFYTKSIAFLKQ